MNNVKTNSIHAWVLASRPKTLTGALVPVLIGSSLAFMHGQFKFTPALICGIFACLMQVVANFINDYFDFIKGTDREDRLGPERACAQGWITPKAMKVGIIITTIIACLVGSSLIYYGGWQLIIVGLLCVVFAFAYTTGPYPLSYHGYGDILVLIFFGFVPVAGTYYVQTLTINWEVLIASLICGLVIDTLLIVNNYRDYEQDKVSGKKTVIVRYGKKFGEQLYLYVGIVATLLALSYASAGHYFAAILPLLYLVKHISVYKEMEQIGQGKELNTILGKTSVNILIMGLQLSLGFILSA